MADGVVAGRIVGARIGPVIAMVVAAAEDLDPEVARDDRRVPGMAVHRANSKAVAVTSHHPISTAHPMAHRPKARRRVILHPSINDRMIATASSSPEILRRTLRRQRLQPRRRPKAHRHPERPSHWPAKQICVWCGE